MEQQVWALLTWRAYCYSDICEATSLLAPFHTEAGIVSNSVYKGEAVFGKDIHRRDEMRSYEINPRTGEPMKSIDSQRPAPIENRIIISCPAIVSVDLWEKAQEVRQSRCHLAGNPQRLRMLSGRILRAECGGRMTLTSSPPTRLQKGRHLLLFLAS